MLIRIATLVIALGWMSAIAAQGHPQPGHGVAQTPAAIASDVEALKVEVRELKASLKIRDEINASKTKVESLEQSLTNYKWIAVTVAGLLGIGVCGSLAWTRNKARGAAESVARDEATKLGEDINRAAQRTRDSLNHEQTQFKNEIIERLDTSAAIVSTGLERMGEQISDMALLQRAIERCAFDAAVAAITWDGKAESLREYSIEVRKLVIEAVVRSTVSTLEQKNLAWKAGEAIYEQSRCERDLGMLYRLAYKTEQRDRGLMYFGRYQHETPMKLNAEGARAIAGILRLAKRLNDAEAVLNAYEGNPVLEVQQLRGHILTNLGRFDDAHAVLRTQVRQIMATKPEATPKTWHMVFTSHILNCTASGRFTDGIKASRFALRKGADSLLILGILRLVSSKRYVSSPIANELIVGVREAVQRVPEDVMTIQTQALLDAMAQDADLDQIISRIETALEGVRAGNFAVYNMERGVYFLACMIAELQIRKEDYAAARKTIREQVTMDNVGEAEFLVACSYAKDAKQEEALDALRRAATIHPRWDHIARNGHRCEALANLLA